MAVFSVMTLLAAVAAIFQVLFLNRQMHRELELQYLLRFWIVTDRFSTDLRSGGEPTMNDRFTIRDYLTLSEDQIGLRKSGRVTSDTWSFWASDIVRFCDSSIYSDLIKSELDQGARAYPLLKQLLSAGESGFDPLEWSSAKKFWRGV